MLGVCIVIVSLFISVLAGFLMDVEKGERDATDYEYITDVTGLFDIGQAPDYITYNPSSNYVGYSSGSVNYTEASSVNSYRFVKSAGEVTNVSKTYTNDSALPGYNPLFPADTADNSVQIYINGQNMPASFGSTVSWSGITYNATRSNPYMFTDTLQTLLNDIDLGGNLTADISISYGSYPVLIIPHSAYTFDSFVGGNDLTYYNYSIDIDWTNDSITRLKVDIPTGTVTAYHNDFIRWSAVASNVDVINIYSTRAGGSFNPASISTTFNATITSPPVYGYADPTAGVTLANSPATWTNDYNNSDILLTVARNTTAYNNLTITAGGSWITVNISNVGAMTVNINGASGSDSKNMGLWTVAQIRINLGAGSVSVTPIVGTADFMAPVAENSSTATWYNWYNGGDLASLTFSSVGASCRWGITETRVFLNTYNAVMNDPSIDITQHFPDLEGWRLNFYSFATVGDSITINNKTFAVGPNQTITVTNDNDSITGQLSDIVVSKDLDGDIWFGFRNGASINLGPAVSNVISFTGLWYFTTGLYEAVHTLASYYEWNIDGAWHANGGQIVIIFLGCILGAVVVCKGLMKIPFKGMDGLVLASAVIFMLIIGGSLI